MKHETKTNKKSYYNLFFSVSRMNLDRAYNQECFFKILISFIQNYYTLSKKYNKNPNIFYTAGDKHFWSYDWSYGNKSIKIIPVFQPLCKYFMVSFIYIDQSRNGFPMTCTLIIIFKVKTGQRFLGKRSLHYISSRESSGKQIEL